MIGSWISINTKIPRCINLEHKIDTTAPENNAFRQEDHSLKTMHSFIRIIEFIHSFIRIIETDIITNERERNGEKYTNQLEE